MQIRLKYKIYRTNAFNIYIYLYTFKPYNFIETNHILFYSIIYSNVLILNISKVWLSRRIFYWQKAVWNDENKCGAKNFFFLKISCWRFKMKKNLSFSVSEVYRDIYIHWWMPFLFLMVHDCFVKMFQMRL